MLPKVNFLYYKSQKLVVSYAVFSSMYNSFIYSVIMEVTLSWLVGK